MSSIIYYSTWRKLNQPLGKNGHLARNRRRRDILLKGVTLASAEFFGTALLVFGSCMATTDGISQDGPISHLQKSLASGLSVTTAIQIFGPISGAHVNPAITLCAVIMKEINVKSVPIYVCSQIAGCLTGYALLMAVTPEKYINLPSGHCLNLPHHDISPIQACFVELIASFFLALAVCASWDPLNSSKTDSISLRIGFIVFWLNIIVGYYTGASMNPARSFGPALCNQKWDNHWIYWVGPIIGCCSAAVLYRVAYLNRPNN